MNRTHFFALTALVACLSTPLAFAYPNAEQKHVVSASGASWTVLQDHRNPLRWYYVPAIAKLVENGKAGKTQPALSLIKYQAPSSTDKSRLEENAFLFLTLSLTPEKATLDQIASAIGNLKPMKDAKAAATDIRLEEIALENIKLKLPESRAEAAAAEGFGLPIPATAVQFSLHLPSVASNLIQKLQSQGFKAQIEFNYVAGTPKPDGQPPKRAAFSAQATGTIGLGAYPKQIQDASILLLLPDRLEHAILKLPPVSVSAGIQQVSYSVSVKDPDGKPISGIRTEAVLSKPTEEASAWMDRERRPVGFLFFPIKALVDQAKKAGKKLEDYKFHIEAEVISANRMGKFSSQAGLLTHGAPVAMPPPPAVSLRLSPEFLESEASDTACDLRAVQVKLACGRQNYDTLIKTNANDDAFGALPTFLFDRACNNIRMENATLICKNVKKQTLPGKQLSNAQGATVYLEN